MERTAATVISALLSTHQTLSVFMAPYLDAIRRWQSMMSLVSAILALLVVNIWMYYSKSLTCCQEARALVGCSAVTSEPCRGFTGDCADLAPTFAGLGRSALGVPGVPADYQCKAFPNDSSYRDTIILGLISWACSLPVNVLILNTFWCANSPDYDPRWLRWDFKRRLLLGQSEWHYATGEAPRPAVARAAATTWCVNAWYNLQQGLAERPVAALFREAQCRRVRRGEAALSPASRLGAGLATQIKLEMFSVVAMACVYLVWAVIAWLIFTYGSLVYRLMGDQAQQKFARGWGVSLAISQATQFKARRATEVAARCACRRVRV